MTGASAGDDRLDTARSRWWAPDAPAIAGLLLTVFGWLLPWFQVSDGYSWSFSGWEFLTLSSGPGWTTLVPIGFAATFIALLWTRGSSAAALTALACTIATGLLVVTMIAACFTMVREPASLDGITTLPFGPGIPVLALGFGITAAAIARRR